MTKDEITSYYDANIKSKLVEVAKDELVKLESAHVNDVEELYFLERNGAFSDYVQWRKQLKTDNDFMAFIKRFSNFYNKSKLKMPPEDSTVIHFNLKWNDFTNEAAIENKAHEKPLSYFIKMNDEFQSEVDRDSAILERVDELKREQKWDLKLDENSPHFAMVYESKVIKTHRDFLLDEVVWLATDFHMEKRWKRNIAKKLALACKRVQREKFNLANQSLQSQLLAKKQTKLVSKLVSDFWSSINKIKLIKIKKYIEYEKQQELNERLKNFVDKTQQYSSNIANKLTTTGSTSNNTSEDDFSRGDEFDPSDIQEDSDQYEQDMKEFIDEENLLDNGILDDELNHLNNDGEMSLDDLINNLPPEYLEEYRKNTVNYNVIPSSSSTTTTTTPSTVGDNTKLTSNYNNNNTHDYDADEISSININKADDGDSNSVLSTNTATSGDTENPNFEMMVENANRYKPTGTTVSTANCKIEPSFLLRGSLREYQLVGLNWLMSLHDNNLNGILADEMGLGKTIQTIALIAHLAGTLGEWGPHLIIVPSSVILNWECEFKKWCPSLKVLAYYGRSKERKAKRHGWSKENAFHVCITSFQLAVQDNIMFKKRRWYYLIIDEAHNIRNSKSVRWNMLLGLNTQRRLLLTGTPLQNHLMELWSLLHFLMPQLFQCEDAFRQWFAQPISSMVFNESSVDETTISKFHQILRPFILRRLKCEVELQIPKKYEHVIKCELSPRQRTLYNEYMMLDSTKSVLQAGNFMSIMQILIQLRKVCNHPDLFEPRPVISPFVSDPPSSYRSHEIASIVDFSQSYLSFIDENRVSMLNKHPLLKANAQLLGSHLRKQMKSSRKRRTDEVSSVLADIVSTASSTIVVELTKNLSVDHYVKRFSKFIDEYIDHLSSTNTTTPIDIDDDNNNNNAVKMPINGNNNEYIHQNLNDNKKTSLKVCDCAYTCDGCGNEQIMDNISVPILRAIIEDEFNNKPTATVINNNQEHYIKLLKQQTISNITRILEFSKMQNYQSDNNYLDSTLSHIESSCVLFSNANAKVVVDQTNCLNSLFNVSKNYFSEYIPYAIREILISAAIRTVAFSFELVKYSHTYSMRSTDNLLHRLSQSINVMQHHDHFEHSSLQHKDNSIDDDDYSAFDDFWRIYINRQLSFPQTRLIQYDCGKLQFLDNFLKRLFQQGHRVLIFTQMSKMLDILEKFLSYHHFTYLRLDGSTKIEHRQYMMELFNSDSSIFVFILSTRAGGLGLNLTGADTVIFYDNDWNPTVDAQAQDRCHRIGQIRDVHIYRLVCRNTVEENILKRAQQKRMLADVTIEGGNFTVSQLEQNFLSDIFGAADTNSMDEGALKLEESVLPAVPVDTTNFESVLKHVEKTEGIDEVDDLATAVKTTSNRQPSAPYDDFCEEIFAMETDMLPVERLALYYLESLLTEQLDATKDDSAPRNLNSNNNFTEDDHHPNHQVDDPCNTDNNGEVIGQQLSNKLSPQYQVNSNHVSDSSNYYYFKPSAEPIEDDGDGDDDMVENGENIQFETFLMEDIKKMSSDDGSQWLPYGTNCFSILNDVYNLDPLQLSDAASSSSSSSSLVGEAASSHEPLLLNYNHFPLSINESIDNNTATTTTTKSSTISTITPVGDSSYVDVVAAAADENDENYIGHTSFKSSTKLSFELIRSYFTLRDNTKNAAIAADHLNVRDLSWLLQRNSNVDDQSCADIEIKHANDPLELLNTEELGGVGLVDANYNNWNSNYYYADNPKDQLTELLFSDESLSISALPREPFNKHNHLHHKQHPEIFNRMFGLMTGAPSTSTKPKSARATCCYSDISHFSPLKNCSYKDHHNQCYSTFKVVCSRSTTAKLYAIMADVVEEERGNDPINWEFFRYAFVGLSQIPYPISHRHFHSWSVQSNNINCNNNSMNANVNTNNVNNKANVKWEKIINYIANNTNKPYMRTKNLKHQRIYKDLNNTSSLSMAAISKYSQFCTATNRFIRDTQSFNNKRNTLSRIHERIKKKHRLMNAAAATNTTTINNAADNNNSTPNTNNSGGGGGGGGSTYVMVNQQRRMVVLDQSKLFNHTNEKLRTSSTTTIQQKLPCLMSSVRKRRTLLESNVMMYNQDKIAKVKQHVSRIAINDHLLCYRDLGSKAIRYVKFIDGKFVKVLPPTIPPAVSHLTPTAAANSTNISHNNNSNSSRISTTNNPMIARSSNLKPFSTVPMSTANSVNSAVVAAGGRSSQFTTNNVTTSTANHQLINYPNQNVMIPRGGGAAGGGSINNNYQRINVLPKTSAISSSNTSAIQAKSTASMTTPVTSNNTTTFAYNNLHQQASSSTSHANTSQFSNINNPTNMSAANMNATASSSSSTSTNVITNAAATTTNVRSMPSNVNLRKSVGVGVGLTNYKPNSTAMATTATTTTIDNKTSQPVASLGGGGGGIVRGAKSNTHVPPPTTSVAVVNSTGNASGNGNMNNSRITQSNNINNKLLNVAMMSPQKVTNSNMPNNNLANLQRTMLLQQQQQQQQQQQYTSTTKCDNIPPDVNNSMHATHMVVNQQQQQQISNLQKQQFQLAQKQSTFLQAQQRNTCGVMNNNNSPLKTNNYNQQSTTTAAAAYNTPTTTSVDSSNVRGSGGGGVVVQPANIQQSQYNQIGNNRQQTIPNCPPTNIQQQQQHYQQRTISTNQQHIIQRLNYLQQQLVQIQQQANLPPRMSQQLQQQNLLAQQQLQQQLIQLQQQQVLIQQQSQNDPTNVVFDVNSNNKTSKFNNNNNIMLRQMQSNQTTGATSSSLGGAGGVGVTTTCANNRLDKSQADVLTLLNNIINSGGNVPIVLQSLLRNNPNPEQPNISTNNMNNRSVAGSSRSGGVMMIPNTNNQPNSTPTNMNIANLRHFIQQPHPSNVTQQQQQQQQQGIVNSRVSTGGGGGAASVYKNTPTTQSNNIPVNHPSFNDIHGGNPSTTTTTTNYSSHDNINLNTFNNIPQNDLYNFLVESKANNSQVSYAALQQFMSTKTTTPKMNSQSGGGGGNNRGGFNHIPNNPGCQNNNP